ncbi:ParB N-terminal domain-containing protein [Plasticicumulans sp.]|uniref:ParB N-terminal domain-containing protein n=1 Tax=Plasticicumulans sp. TaxID=2307179 RepID=UPI00392A84A8
MTSTAISKLTDVLLGDTTKVSVDWLRLDGKNPRLVGISARTTEESIVAQLYRGEELGELIQSIAANGYLNIEPLIVCLEEPTDQKFTVLEGNRRLAAIRLFREPALVEAIAKSERLKIDVPGITPAVLATLAEVSVYRVDSRDAARSFIGFKHINGAAKWESYAKAKFAAEWYQSGNVSLEEISEKIGDRHDTIKRMVAAIYVLEQAERKGVFSVSDRKITKFNFSHLYTALSRTPYMNYVGLETAWSRYDPKPDPVPSDKLDRLREVLVWIYGSKEDNKEPVIRSQNPDIKYLGETLANIEGVHVLRAGGTLAEAHASTRPADETFSAALIRARSTLREAISSLRGYDGSDQSLLNIAEDVFESAQTIFDRMKKKNKVAIGDERGN